MKLCWIASASLALVGLCACSGLSSQPHLDGTSAATAGALSAAGRNAGSGQTVYVIGNAIAAFDTSTLQLLRTYQGIKSPGGAIEDTQGDLYVSDFNSNDVVEFYAGQTRIVQTFAQGMSEPSAMTFDGSGNLYVANDGPASNGGNSVTVYDAAGTLLRTITSGIQHPTQLAFDSIGELYVSNLGGPVTIYAGGGSTETGSISQINESAAILLDSSDDVYVADCNFDATTASCMNLVRKVNRCFAKSSTAFAIRTR